MPQARDEAGNIWEIDAQGNPVRLVQAAQGPTTIGTPDPTIASREADRAADNARADAALALQQQQAGVTNQLRGVELELKRQQLERDGVTGKQKAEWQSNLKNLDLLEGQLASLRKQYEENFAGKGPLQSLAESYAPSGIAPQYAVFDQTAQSMIADMAKAKGLTSQQFNTPAEQRMFFEPLLPKRGDPDEVIVSKLDYLEKMIASGRATTEQNLGIAQQQADKEVPDPTIAAPLKNGGPTDPGPLPPANEPGGNDPTPWDNSGGPQSSVAQGGFRSVRDERASSMITSLVNAGASEATINAALKQAGLPPIPLGQLAAVRAWMKANPDKQWNNANVNRLEPMTLMQEAAGSPLGAFGAQMANTATGGIPAYLAGAQGEGALAAMEATHPNASLAGGITGGITGLLGGEAALGARAPAALAKYVPRAADMLFGATTGYTGAGSEATGTDRLTHAALGAALAPVMGKAGEKVMGGLGTIAKGAGSDAVDYLRQQGVPMTVGQVLGGIPKKIEDRATSWPLVGDMIQNRRLEGLQEFDRAGFRQGGQTIGANVEQIGQQGVEQLLGDPSNPFDGGLTGQAYDAATAGVNVPLDPEYVSGFEQVVGLGQRLPDDLRARFGLALNNRVNPINDAGELTGETYQQAIRGLKGYKAETPKPGFENDYRDAISAAQNVLTEQMERGGGQDVVTGLRNADIAYRNAKTLEDAVNRAKGGSMSGETYTFTPSQLQGSIEKTQRKFPGVHPLQELADYGQQVLPSRVPDSGTAGRAAQMVMPGVIGGGAAAGYGLDGAEGAGTGAGLGLGATLALMAGGTRRGQMLMTELLLNRPEVLRSLGKGIQSHARIGGRIGSGAITPLLVGPQ